MSSQGRGWMRTRVGQMFFRTRETVGARRYQAAAGGVAGVPAGATVLHPALCLPAARCSFDEGSLKMGNGTMPLESEVVGTGA